MTREELNDWIRVYNDIVDIASKTISNCFGEDRVDAHPFYIDKELERFDISMDNISNLTQIGVISLLRDSGCRISECSSIYIYFPEETVTNENGESHKIYDVYIRVNISVYDGNSVRISMSRGAYSPTEVLVNYMHSHVPYISGSGVSQDPFVDPCFGSGPLAHSNADQDKKSTEYWVWLCNEIQRFIRVESLRGGPFYHLVKLKDQSNSIKITDYCYYIHGHSLLSSVGRFFGLSEEFIPFLIRSKVLTFAYTNGRYTLDMPITNYMVSITREFVEWDKRKGGELSKTFLRKYSYGPGYILLENPILTRRVAHSSLGLNNKYVCTFKEEDIHVKIIESIGDTENKINLLDYFLAMFILNRILETINVHYK